MPRLKPVQIQPHSMGHRVAFVTVATLLLFTAVILPFALGDVVDDLSSPPTNRVYRLLSPQNPEPEHLRLHLTVVSMDDPGRTVTLLGSGHQVCPDGCDQRYQVLLVSLMPEGPDTEGLPPSAVIKFPETAQEVTQSIALPVHGDPIRYPFDRYQFGVGVVLQRALADGTIEPVPAAEAARRLFLTLQTQVQRVDMTAPRTVGAERIETIGGSYPFITVEEVTFNRPLYLKVLTVLLVLLVTAAAAFAVFMRPLNELVTNVGALVLGIWGVRAILVGTSAIPGASAVDLSLSMIILFLLAAITVRALTYLDERSGFNVLRWMHGGQTDNVPDARSEAGPTAPKAASTGDRPGESRPSEAETRSRAERRYPS